MSESKRTSGQRLGPIPRGVEVLVKKASVDATFRRSLLAERAEAAKRIGLTLDPAEAMMLTAVSAEQLETIIARTTVPREHRRAFLGTAAAAMLAAVGLVSPGCGSSNPPPAGIAPDDPKVDENGRPKRSIMADEGGAAPDEPPEWPDEPEPPPPVDGSAEDSGASPEDAAEPPSG